MSTVPESLKAYRFHYVVAANLLYPAAFQFRVDQSDLDPAAFIRTALSAGRAKLVGKATRARRAIPPSGPRI